MTKQQCPLAAWPGVIIVRPAKVGETTPGGIVLPAKVADSDLQYGVVEDFCPFPESVKDWPYLYVDLAVGDTVFYTGYAGVTVEHDDRKYFTLSYGDIKAVLREEISSDK